MSTMTDRHAGLRAELDTFADTLEAAGYRVHRPGPTWMFIGFAREVDGEWCSATVQASDFGNADGWQWLMNIIPSREDGSSMFLDDVPDGSSLTVETAEQVTRPDAINSVISKRRPNAGWPKHWGSPGESLATFGR